MKTLINKIKKLSEAEIKAFIFFAWLFIMGVMAIYFNAKF